MSGLVYRREAACRRNARVGRAKIPYPTVAAAVDTIRDLRATGFVGSEEVCGVYWCGVCRAWHWGRRRGRHWREDAPS